MGSSTDCDLKNVSSWDPKGEMVHFLTSLPTTSTRKKARRRREGYAEEMGEYTGKQL